MAAKFLLLVTVLAAMAGCSSTAIHARQTWPWPPDTPSPQHSPQLWQSIGRCEYAEIFVQRTLYTIPDHNFLICFAILNITDREIAVDLRRYEEVLRPEAFDIYLRQHAPMLTPPNLLIQRLSRAEQKLVDADYRHDRLTRIPPQMGLCYFAAVPRGTQQDVLKSSGHVLTFTMTGDLYATDGKQPMRFFTSPAPLQRTVEMTLPARWASVPEGAIVMITEGPRLRQPSMTVP